ncbi:MAG: sugar nucleotide-binding protein, partial [Roseiflexaceae bacterium]|nr:sugar nucleotide-binding protein [Roseiflexaceae bacterium]
MTIVVTGANGQLGQVVAAYLDEQGIPTLRVDRTPASYVPHGAALAVDLTDLGQTYDALHGA